MADDADPWKVIADEAKALADEFRRIRGRLKPAMRKAAAKSALALRDDARARIIAQSTKGFLKQYPRSITHTVTDSSGSVVKAEVGPDKNRAQGALGNILEYGTSTRPPYPHLQPALDAEAEGFEKNLGDAAEEAMFE